jgi:glycosyltransferase involved in cell wall biosynthesis
MVTSVAPAYPWRHDKLAVVGQGIDTAVFSPDGPPDSPPLVLCAGRLSPAKDHPTLLRAFRLLVDRTAVSAVNLALVGGPAVRSDEAYRASLGAQVDQLGLRGRVRFVGSVIPSLLADWYRRCTVHVNLTPTGFGDKVALEAMACGRPSLIANEGFRDTLGGDAAALMFRHGDADDLAAHLASVLQMPASDREALGSRLRANIVERHGFDRLMDRLVELARASAQGA